MKKTLKKLSLNREAIRKLSGTDLQLINGGDIVHSNLDGCTHDCTRVPDVCQTNPRTGTGSFYTCFAAGCVTILTQ